MMPLPEYPPWRAPAPTDAAAVRAATKTLTCDICGALIGDRRIHARWHTALRPADSEGPS